MNSEGRHAPRTSCERVNRVCLTGASRGAFGRIEVEMGDAPIGGWEGWEGAGGGGRAGGRQVGGGVRHCCEVRRARGVVGVQYDDERKDSVMQCLQCAWSSNGRGGPGVRWSVRGVLWYGEARGLTISSGLRTPKRTCSTFRRSARDLCCACLANMVATLYRLPSTGGLLLAGEVLKGTRWA